MDAQFQLAKLIVRPADGDRPSDGRAVSVTLQAVERDLRAQQCELDLTNRDDRPQPWEGRGHMSLVGKMDRVFYPDFTDFWDDHLFRKRVLHHLGPDKHLLDVGAGAGIVAMMNFKGLAQRVCGVDLDPRVVDNPMLDEGVIGNAGALPYGDGQFDVVIADNVAEHLADPKAALLEVWRVLKPGGVFLFKTPNRMHYMPTIARITPHWFHQAFNRLRGRSEVDTFPTLYRLNSRRTVYDLAQQTAFEVEHFELIEGRPEYLRLNPITYLAGLAYERTVNASGLLAFLRILIVATLRKPL